MPHQDTAVPATWSAPRNTRRRRLAWTMEHAIDPMIQGAGQYARGLLGERMREREKSEEEALRQRQERATAAQTGLKLATEFGIEPEPGIFEGTPYSRFGQQVEGLAPEVRLQRGARLGAAVAPVERVPGSQVGAARALGYPGVEPERIAPFVRREPPLKPGRQPMPWEEELARARTRALDRPRPPPRAAQPYDLARLYPSILAQHRQEARDLVMRPWQEQVAAGIAILRTVPPEEQVRLQAWLFGGGYTRGEAVPASMYPEAMEFVKSALSSVPSAQDVVRETRRLAAEDLTRLGRPMPAPLAPTADERAEEAAERLERLLGPALPPP